MNFDHIDFISAYCDGWCERCALTSRCSASAVQIAVATCEGDVRAGIELAGGVPPAENEAEARRREAVMASLLDHEPTAREMARYAREQQARDERVDESPITTSATKVTLLARVWLDGNREQVLTSADPQVRDAIDVAEWDAWFIAAKLNRALDGRDEYLHGEDFDDDPVQNDWNGSAKVALISITRSTVAWRLLAETTGDPAAVGVAEELTSLQQLAEGAFPDAWKFVRPGFDQPPA